MLLPFLVLGLVFRFGPVLGCDWDQSLDPNQDLDPDRSSPALLQAPWTEVSDPESCRMACCASQDCDLALVNQSTSGAHQCKMVSCGVDLCALKNSSQVQVYRKSVQMENGQQEPTNVDTQHVEPLLDLPGPQSNETNDVLCRLPVKVGPCRAAFPRFFYNVTSQTCSGFIYGGCDANSNNFLSQQDCENTCNGVSGSVLPEDSTPAPPQPAAKAVRMAPAEFAPLQSAERCEAEPKAGPCRAAITRWFFNKKTGSCQTFTYGGCKGNKNNYESEESCRVTCTDVTDLPSSKEVSDEHTGPVDNKEHCTLSPDPGMCRAAFPMFYYDPDSASCQGFVYGGCGGNANNFPSLKDCMKSCGGEGMFDGRAKTRGRWTAAFFLFISLAVICVLLLTTLVIITLRRHRLTRRYSTASDKQELLPEADDLSSLDSMTVHETPKPEPTA